MERITEFFNNIKEWFLSLEMGKRAVLVGAAVCIAAGACVALAMGSGGGNAPENTVAGARKTVTDGRRTERPKKAEETVSPTVTAVPDATEGIAPSAAPIQSAAAVPAASSAGSAADEGQAAEPVSGGETSGSGAAGLTGESAIAANAATDGGSDVVSYQEENEQYMISYEMETVPQEEQRLVATSAAVCDIMDRLGLDLIGVPQTTVSAVPARYSGVTRVGSAMEPDMEIIKSLDPTDVIGPDTLQADLKMKYDNIGVNSTFLNLRSVEGLYESVRILGHKYGKQAEADAMIQEYNDFMASYSSGHEGEERPKVLVLMGLPGSYLVATQNSYAGSLVELAGGINVFHDDSKDFLSVNTEALLACDPDVIIRTAHGLPDEAIAMFEREFSENDIWKHFRAVKEGRVYDVDYMLFGMSATFDYPQALADLEPMLYGD